MGPFTHSLSYSNAFCPGKVDKGEMDLLPFSSNLDKAAPKRKDDNESTKIRRDEILGCFFFVPPVFRLFVMSFRVLLPQRNTNFIILELSA